MRRLATDATLAATVLALSPLLLAQALRVRQVTPRLPEPGGAREGRHGLGPALRLLIIGDSAAAGVGAASQEEALAGQLTTRLAPHFQLHWQLLAHSGDRVRDARRRLAEASALRTDVVLTSLGVNDVTALRSAGAYVDELRHLVQELRARQTRLFVVSGLPPMHSFPALPQPLRWALGTQARRFDARLAAWCGGQPDCLHLPFGELPDTSMMASDGFHPGPPIYARWADAATAAILARWPAAAATLG
jgi:lysophospholipase L1-like esterase